MVLYQKICGPLACLASGLPASKLHMSREFFIRTSPKFRIRLSPQGALFAICLGFVPTDPLSPGFSEFQACSGLGSRRNALVFFGVVGGSGMSVLCVIKGR